MRILLTKGTPSAPKSQPRFIHIHKSLGKSCLCSLEPEKGTEKTNKHWHKDREKCKKRPRTNGQKTTLIATVHCSKRNLFRFHIRKSRVGYRNLSDPQWRYAPHWITTQLATAADRRAVAPSSSWFLRHWRGDSHCSTEMHHDWLLAWPRANMPSTSARSVGARLN